MTRVLLTNAESAKALVCARALGRAGIEVYLAGYHKLAPGFFSRYCRKGFVVSQPPSESFVEDIMEIVEREGIDVLLPVNSLETLELAKHKKRIERLCEFPFVDYEKMRRVNDKFELMKLAKRLGLPIPKTHFIRKPEDFESVRMPFPWVVKLPVSKSSKGVFFVNSLREAKEVWEKHGTGQRVVVQEFFGGEGWGASFLYWKGRMVAYFVHRRLREYPITGGPSTLRVSERDERLVETGKRLLDKLRWHGVAMVEYKKEGEKFAMIEVNPRLWGSVHEAIASGVNFPYLLVKLAMGEEPNVEPGKYKLGVKTRLFFNDVRAVLSLIKHKKAPLSSLLEIFSPIPSDEFSKDDFLPALPYLAYVLLYKRGSLRSPSLTLPSATRR